jgi:hypothetical protein
VSRPLLLAVALALAAIGCAPKPPAVGSPTVVTRPPIAAASPDEVFGHQAIVWTEDARYFGELVACDTEDVFLHLNLDPAGGAPWVRIPWRFVTHAEVSSPGSGLPTTVVWTLVGSFSTATHGLWFAFSLPIWGLVGGPSIAWAAQHQHVDGSCLSLLPYARYPQGLPAAMRDRFAGPPPAAPPPEAPPAPICPPAAPPPGEPPPAPAAPPAASP